jgi:hypothetical protein
MEPMAHTSSILNRNYCEETCSRATSERFHKCHDETMIDMDAITDFKKELLSQREDDHNTKKILGEARQREGRVMQQVAKQDDEDDVERPQEQN